MWITLYLLYAVAQAILLVRCMDQKSAEVFMVFIVALFAPLATLIAAVYLIECLIKFLLTYKR